MRGFNVFHTAVCGGNLGIVEFLYNQDRAFLKILAKEKENALMIAAHYGHLEVFKFLHKKNPKLLTQLNIYGMNAVFIAAKFGHLNIIEYIYQNDKNILKETDKENCNVFLMAADFDKLDIVKFLLEKYPDMIRSKTKDKQNALHVSTILGSFDVAKYLTHLYPELLNENDINAHLPFFYAVGKIKTEPTKKKEYEELAKLMIEQRLKISSKTIDLKKDTSQKAENSVVQTSKKRGAKPELPSSPIPNTNSPIVITEPPVPLTAGDNFSPEFPSFPQADVIITNSPSSAEKIDVEISSIPENKKHRLLGTLQKRSSRGKILHVSEKQPEDTLSLVSGEKSEDKTEKSSKSRKSMSLKTSIFGEKSEDKSEISERGKKAPKSNKEKRIRIITNDESRSVTQSKRDNASVSRSERNDKSCVSKSERSELMGDGEFKSLVEALRQRDVHYLSQVQLDQKIIMETLLTLEAKGLVEVKRLKNNKVRATFLGDCGDNKVPSLTIHMHDHDKSWARQHRVRQHFLTFIEHCGLNPATILWDKEGDGAGEGESS